MQKLYMAILKSNIEKVMDNFKKVGIVLASFVACTSAQAIDIIKTGDITLSIGVILKQKLSQTCLRRATLL